MFSQIPRKQRRAEIKQISSQRLIGPGTTFFSIFFGVWVRKGNALDQHSSRRCVVKTCLVAHDLVSVGSGQTVVMGVLPVISVSGRIRGEERG
jgi:hypothetical protein